MTLFEFLEPNCIETAVSLLLEDPAGTVPIAGGTDLLAETKDGIKSPRRLVSLSALKELCGVDRSNGSTRLGAAITLTRLADDSVLQQDYPILSQAALTIATPQVRNIGTLGGNLCQRPRCWYYRHHLFPCYKKGGTVCYGANGYNRNLAILGGGASFMVHPSDMAPVLIAMDARLEAFGPQGFRTMALHDFFAGPNQRQLQEHVLEHGEIVTSVLLPPPPENTRSIYLKAQDRPGEDFALASVAASITLQDNTVTRANVILGGVAPTPYRARLTEDFILGKNVGDLDLRQAAQLAVHHARPLQFNEFKISLTVNLTQRALEALLNP